jgi:hypothetical protein
MPWRRDSQVACSFCVLLLSLGAARADAPLLSASVHDGDSHAVGQEEVRIENVGSYLTSNSGEFEFRAPQPPGRDSAVRFRVRNWVIVKPCELINGRTFLPATGTVDIKVYQLGDNRLIDAAYGALLSQCLVEEMASHFEPKRGSAAHSQGFMTPHHFGGNQRRDAAIVSVSWQGSFRKVSASELPLGRNDFLAKKSKELGFSAEQLASALEEWAKSPGDSYHRGLGALYEGKYTDAAVLIAESIRSSERALTGRYVSLARAEYELLHFENAKSALVRALEVHPGDEIVQADLNLVSEAMAKSAAETQVEQPPVQGQNTPGRPTSSPSASATTLIAVAAAAILVLFVLLYYAYKRLIRALEKFDKVDLTSQVQASTATLECPETVTHKATVTEAVVAAAILFRLYNLLRIVGRRPPDNVVRIIDRVRSNEVHETAGSGT